VVSDLEVEVEGGDESNWSGITRTTKNTETKILEGRVKNIYVY
jgi:hypothetical protein